MRFSEGKGHPVVATHSADTVGKVQRFVVDASQSRVVALVLKKTAGKADVLRWDDVITFGPDAVTAESASRLVEAEGQLARLADKKHAVLGRRVLTDAGNEVGEVDDIEFDPADGSIRHLLTSGGEIAGSQLLGLGSYALMVRQT